MGFFNAVQGLYHQANPWDSGRTYDTNSAGRNPGYRQATSAPAAQPFVVRTGPTGTSYGTGGGGMSDAQLAAMRAQTNAILAQTAAMPRLPSFDILGNYNRAKSQAEANQRPLYDKMLNTFLEGQGIKRTAKQKETALGKENVATTQRITKEDIGTNRQRTVEDVMAALQQIGVQEGQFQRDEGVEFEKARRGLEEGMAASGLTTSGLGQAAIGEQQEERNVVSDRQTQNFQIQRQAKELFRNRTFEDLAKGELRADEKALLQNKEYDLNLDTYLQNLAQEEKVYRSNWEADLLGAIAEETGRLDREGTMQFINSLVGSGARAQDIALAKQVYL